LAGINKEGRMLQIGGVGAVSADMGGGGYMGERLVSAVYSELFRKGKATLMTGLLFKELGITSKYDYIEKMHEKQNDGSFDIYNCSRLVFEAVRQNDPVAAGILLEIAGNYANGISCMIEELGFPPEEELNLVFAGSVFVKGEHPLLLDSIKAKVNRDNGDWNINYKLLDVPNVAGAVIWALDSLEGKNVSYDKICMQLQDKY
jgi:N-acetylglucosamine kinase-like BadF-type ATPase